MNYYDNVKDNVKDESGGSSNKPSFDTLKEEAEKTSVEEDEEENSGDGTPIEVLEEGGLREEKPSQSQTGQQQRQQTPDQQNQSRTQAETSGNSRSQQPQAGSSSGSASQQDMSGVEEKLDELIEQNQRIIEVLESFGN